MRPQGTPVPEFDLQRYAALAAMVGVVSEHQNPEDLFRNLAPLMRAGVSFDVMTFALHDPARNVMKVHVWCGGAWPRTPLLYGVDNSACGWVWLNQTSLTIDEVAAEKRFNGAMRPLLDCGVNSYCALPLTRSLARLGVLGLGSKKDHAFSAQDIGYLQRVAGLVALGVENIRAHEAVKREKQRRETLRNIGQIVASNWQVPEIFPKVSAVLRRLMQQEYAAFTLHDETSGLLVRQAIDFPLGKGLLDGVEINPLSSPGGQALQERKTMIFERGDIEAFHSEITDKILEEGIKSMCCVPLARPKGPAGVLALGSTRYGAFEPEDVELLDQVASQLALALENSRAAQQIDELKSRLDAEKRYLDGEIRSELHFDEIVGESSGLKRVLEQVSIVAASDANVLILGETGTGKELIARAIHRLSRRKDEALIKVNCAAIPTGLLESELFGHERGAFTGAISQKVGRMELADGGTFFLDEVGEIPLELQPKLLRVLQDHEFERLGGTRTIKVNLRLVAATNRDLAQQVQEKTFRRDLFYRLNVFPIHVPALRDRREDIPLMVRCFVRKYAKRMDRHIESIPSEAMNALIKWHWPGNVRELENFIERSVILTDGPTLRVPLGELQGGTKPVPALEPTLENAEREHILRVLRETGGVISGPRGAAAKLGLKRTTLQSKMGKLGIHRADYVDPT